MSYVITIWEQPADAELAADITVVAAAVATARKASNQAPANFRELAKRLMSRYPGAGLGTVADSVWSGGGAVVPNNLAVWDLALNEESDKLEEVLAIIAAWATDLGLNVYDKEASEAYLADGRVISRRPQARCVRGIAAYATKDFTNAWHYFMAEANRGNRLAMENLAMMAVRGEGVPRCKEVAYALFMRANNTEEAEKLGKYMDAAQVDAAARLLSELRESTIVSTAVEEQVKRTAGSASGQYKILDPKAASRTEPQFARDLSLVPLDVLLREAQQGDRHARYDRGRRVARRVPRIGALRSRGGQRARRGHAPPGRHVSARRGYGARCRRRRGAANLRTRERPRVEGPVRERVGGGSKAPGSVRGEWRSHAIHRGESSRRRGRAGRGRREISGWILEGSAQEARRR